MSSKKLNVELSSRLQTYYDEFAEDVKLNTNNLKDKSLFISSIRAKWIRYYFIEKALTDKLKAAKMEYSKKLAGNISISEAFPTAIPQQDAGLIKLNEELLTSTRCIEFIDKGFNVLDTFNFQIKNAVDILKLENS